jgi:tetratricopeptide (TPR) repeat protein
MNTIPAQSKRRAALITAAMLAASELLAETGGTNPAPLLPVPDLLVATNRTPAWHPYTNLFDSPPVTKRDAAVEPTNAAVPPEIDVALRRSQEVLASTNLLPAKQTIQQQARIEVLYHRLEQARQQRRDKDYKQSEKTLASLLATNAPLEIHRSALLEMALLAQDTKQLVRAQQVYAQYVQRFKEDPSVPEVLLRQGLLYREMGAPVMALSKFYAVMSSALTLKLDRLTYYQRLVLQAQTEIADTYYLDGKYEEAADFFNRLLKLDNPELNREQILFKSVRSWSAAGRWTEALAQAQLFVSRHPNSDQLPEVRFLLADALKRLGRKREAMQEVLALMQTQRAVADQNQETWLYWQQRTGNEIANQLYQEGDYLNALEIYLRLADLNATPTWRLPARYQAGLIYERLKQPQKAAEMYTRIIEDSKDLGGELPSASLTTVLEMAKWRRERLGWQSQAELANQQISRAAAPATTPKQ